MSLHRNHHTRVHFKPKMKASRVLLTPGTESILLAISDVDLREQVYGVLDGMEACSLTCVEDSGDVLLKLLDNDIDLAIIDENIAGMDGSKLVEIIKKSRPRIPLITISSGNSKDALARVLEQGVFYFFITPINGEELRQAVESALKINP